MDFCSFISIAGDIVFPLSKERFQKSRILGNRFKFSQNTEKDKRDAIRLCFQTLFTNRYTTAIWTNDFFLDWSTPTSSLENHPPGVIKILGGENGEKNYLFLASEIFSIFHNDLSRSSAEIENQYGICTVSKAFRPKKYKIFFLKSCSRVKKTCLPTRKCQKFIIISQTFKKFTRNVKI